MYKFRVKQECIPNKCIQGCMHTRLHAYKLNAYMVRYITCDDWLRLIDIGTLSMKCNINYV